MILVPELLDFGDGYDLLDHIAGLHVQGVVQLQAVLWGHEVVKADSKRLEMHDARLNFMQKCPRVPFLTGVPVGHWRPNVVVPMGWARLHCSQKTGDVVFTYRWAPAHRSFRVLDSGDPLAHLRQLRAAFDAEGARDVSVAAMATASGSGSAAGGAGAGAGGVATAAPEAASAPASPSAVTRAPAADARGGASIGPPATAAVAPTSSPATAATAASARSHAVAHAAAPPGAGADAGGRARPVALAEAAAQPPVPFQASATASARGAYPMMLPPATSASAVLRDTVRLSGPWMSSVRAPQGHAPSAPSAPPAPGTVYTCFPAGSAPSTPTTESRGPGVMPATPPPPSGNRWKGRGVDLVLNAHLHPRLKGLSPQGRREPRSCTSFESSLVGAG